MLIIDKKWNIFLSGAVFSLSFLFSNLLGFTIIFSFILLYFTLKELVIKESLSKSFLMGFVWGVIAFSLHFIWLYELLLNKSQANFWLSIIIFLFATIYYSIFSGLWFFLTKIIFYFLKFFSFSIVITTVMFFWFLEKYSLFIFFRTEGYPFLNPLLPLVKYKIFLFVYSLIFLNFTEQVELKDTKIFYLKPVPKAGELSSVVVGQMIYQKLCSLNLKKFSEKYKNLIVLAPETTFPFMLNKHEEMLNFWGNALPQNSYFLIGSQREAGEKRFQTIYCIKKCRIIYFYDKTHTVAFTEKIPKKWKQFKFSDTFFLKGKNEFNRGTSCKVFRFSEDLILLPQVCSEFFFGPKLYSLSAHQKTILLLFANDSWFMNYFKNILENFVFLKQIQLGLPLLYITHSKIAEFNISLSK